MKLANFFGGALIFLLASSAFAQVSVRSASYGRNCGAWSGNATNHVSYQCDGRNICDYYISVTNLGDPAPGCPKNFEVTFTCGWNGGAKTETVFQEANGKSIRLDCSYQWPTYGVNIQSATYGANVGASWGNVTSAVSRVCKGLSRCLYYISTQELGDPVPGYTKDFRVSYTCGDGYMRQAYAAPEANGATVDLICY